MTIKAWGGDDTTEPTGGTGLLQDGDQTWLRDVLGKQFPTAALDTDGTGTGLQLYADGTGMNVKIRTGSGMISGFGFDVVADELIPIPPNPSASPRLDLAVLRLDLTRGNGNGQVYSTSIQGTPGATPSAPAPLATSTQIDLVRGTARVEAGAGTTGNAVQSLTADKAVPTALSWRTGTRRGRGVIGFASMTANSADPPAAGNTGTEFLLPALKVGPVFLSTQRLIKGWLKLDISGSVDGLRVAAKVRCNSGSAIGVVATSDPAVAGGAEHARVVGSFTTRPVTLAIPFHHVAAAGWHTWQASFFQDSSTADYAYVLAGAAQPSQLLIEDAGAA